MSAESLGFPVARCAPCGRDALVHTVLDQGDEERMRCVACDAEIDPQELRWIDEAALGALGYAVGGEVQQGGCGRGGCGSGRCGRPSAPEPAT